MRQREREREREREINEETYIRKDGEKESYMILIFNRWIDLDREIY